MKRIVWANKSNGQLCMTIPKESGIKEGDIVEIEKHKILSVVYTPVTADLFHFGHLKLLQKSNELGDLHVCGVLTDKAIKTYKDPPIASLKERKAIISNLRCVDMVMVQKELDPTENLKILHAQFPQAALSLVYGSNWKKIPGADFMKKINGKIVQPPFYERLSMQNTIKKMLRHLREDKQS